MEKDVVKTILHLDKKQGLAPMLVRQKTIARNQVANQSFKTAEDSEKQSITFVFDKFNMLLQKQTF